MKDTNESNYLLVDERVLPEIFQKVVFANYLLESGKASNTSEAARLAGVSRSVFYKYKDSIFRPEKEKTTGILTVQFVLMDEPGVLVKLLSVFSEKEANILTVNQNIPVKGKAFVSISAQMEPRGYNAEVLLKMLRAVDGVVHMECIRE